MTEQSRDLAALLQHAQQALGLPHRAFGQLLGSSHRTAERWAAGRSRPSRSQFAKLVVHVHARNPALAAAIATSLGTPLDGLVAVPPPAAAAPTAATPAPELVDAVARRGRGWREDLSPRLVRPALHAAFARARNLGLDVAGVAAALAPPAPQPAKRVAKR